jgi:unspecific monooxygenase
VAAGKYPQALRGAASDRHVAEAFVKETLRLYPPIWMTSRRVLCAARFGEHVLAEGSVVLISTRLLHEDARWWRSDPARFAPQRWFDDRPHAPHAYLPYGSGPRICLGAQLSQALLVQAAALLDTHRSVRVTPADPPARIDTVLPPAKLRATLTLR